MLDDANIRDIEHIQDFFTRLSNMLVDAEENIYEEISRQNIHRKSRKK
jgi:hypothetical protein